RGLAGVADGFVAAETAADVQDRGRLVEGAAVVTPAVAARHERRTDKRKTNLAAVVVASEHEMNAVLLRPADVVGCVAQAESKGAVRAVGQIWCRLKPGAFMADHYEAFAAHFDLLPGVAKHANAQAAQTPACKGRLVPGIVVAEHRE